MTVSLIDMISCCQLSKNLESDQNIGRRTNEFDYQNRDSEIKQTFVLYIDLAFNSNCLYLIHIYFCLFLTKFAWLFFDNKIVYNF